MIKKLDKRPYDAVIDGNADVWIAMIEDNLVSVIRL